MPMLADLDDPPRSQLPGVLLGVLVVAPFVALAVIYGLPALRAAVVGAMDDYDERLRQEDAYMQAVCGQVMLLERDEELCQCVLAIDYPSLDCRPQFNAWSLARQTEACRDADMRRGSVSFCACVEALDEELASAPPEARGEIQQRYGNCAELEDAFALPTLETLADWAPDPAPSSGE